MKAIGRNGAQGRERDPVLSAAPQAQAVLSEDGRKAGGTVLSPAGTVLAARNAPDLFLLCPVASGALT